jgi:hypothetical protein
LLTVSEAAALVRGDNSTIENWKKMGRLKPVSGPRIDGSKWCLYSRNDVEALARGFASPPSVQGMVKREEGVEGLVSPKT